MDCRDPVKQEILFGIAYHLEAMYLAIQPTLTEQDKEKYRDLWNKWVASYLAKEPLKNVRTSVLK